METTYPKSKQNVEKTAVSGHRTHCGLARGFVSNMTSIWHFGSCLGVCKSFRAFYHEIIPAATPVVFVLAPPEYDYLQYRHRLVPKVVLYGIEIPMILLVSF
jgi:hypothetical protein